MVKRKNVILITLKREVAVHSTGFPWSECQVRKLTTSHKYNYLVEVLFDIKIFSFKIEVNNYNQKSCTPQIFLRRFYIKKQFWMVFFIV